MIQILIVDDHALIRSGLSHLIEAAGDMVVVAEAANGAQALELLGSREFDVLLLDINMPGLTGMELIERLHAVQPALPILILSMHDEGQIVRRALAAGAAGYISKSSDMLMLVEAIRKLAAGGRFIDPALVDAAVFDSGLHEPQPHEVLTKRELLVLRMIATGQPITSIALQLHLSAKTVSTHKMRLMKKLHINNNADLVLFAFRHQLMDNIPPATPVARSSSASK
ncbi:response regulator [Herminiimonas sp. NPDC097707]|uniref:response regulator n=1 Tax=Herminiimonas sp. NPDC097707 TaxID=3364007 RepID=UPI00383A959F